jgi:ABC-type multidrug transport system fused ATPase/permease subunit
VYICVFLAKLVQRLYVPESGRVLVDGTDLAPIDLAWLRRRRSATSCRRCARRSTAR